MRYSLVKFCFCIDPLFEIRTKSVFKLKPLQVLLIHILSFFWTSCHLHDKSFLLLSGSLVFLSIFNEWPCWMLLENQVLCEPKGLFAFFCCVCLGFFLCLFGNLGFFSCVGFFSTSKFHRSLRYSVSSPFQQISYLLIRIISVLLVF